MSGGRTAAPHEVIEAVRARLQAAKAAGIKPAAIAEKVGIHITNIWNIREGLRGVSVEMAERFNAALDSLQVPASGPPSAMPVAISKVKKAPHTSISKTEADALRSRVRELLAQPGVSPNSVRRRLRLSTGTWYQWFHHGHSMMSATAAKVWQAIGVERPADFAAAAPVRHPATRPYVRGHKAAKLDQAFMKELAELARATVLLRKQCTVEELCRAAHLMTRQGLFAFWTPTGPNTISPDRADAMLRFLVDRGIRGAKTLLARLQATGLVGTSTPSAAPGTPPRAAAGVTVQLRDRMRAALNDRFGGNVPLLAKALGMTAAKVVKILGGASTLTERDAERIAERLPAPSSNALAPYAAIRALAGGAGTAADDPVARGAPVPNGAVGFEARRMVSRWKDEAFAFFLSFASGNVPEHE